MVNILEGIQYSTKALSIKSDFGWIDVPEGQRIFEPSTFRIKPYFKALIKVDDKPQQEFLNKPALLTFLAIAEPTNKIEIHYVSPPKYDPIAKKLQYRVPLAGPREVWSNWTNITDIDGFSSNIRIEFRIRPDYRYKVSSQKSISYANAVYFDDAVVLADHFKNKITTDSFDSFVVTREKY
jgi:hypothetical protein